jgi:hypothetical protein
MAQPDMYWQREHLFHLLGALVKVNGGEVEIPNAFIDERSYELLIHWNSDSPNVIIRIEDEFLNSKGVRASLEGGPKPRPSENLPTLRGDKTLSDLVIEQRDE